jgi:hypothetical protein
VRIGSSTTLTLRIMISRLLLTWQPLGAATVYVALTVLETPMSKENVAKLMS